MKFLRVASLAIALAVASSGSALAGGDHYHGDRFSGVHSGIERVFTTKLEALQRVATAKRNAIERVMNAKKEAIGRVLSAKAARLSALRSRRVVEAPVVSLKDEVVSYKDTEVRGFIQTERRNPFAGCAERLSRALGGLRSRFSR